MEQVPTYETTSRQINWGCCDKLGSLDPRAWNCDNKKVAQIAAAILLICSLALTGCLLTVQYPTASSAFITTFSIIGIGSLIALCIALVKHCRNSRVIFRSPVFLTPNSKSKRPKND